MELSVSLYGKSAARNAAKTARPTSALAMMSSGRLRINPPAGCCAATSPIAAERDARHVNVVRMRILIALPHVQIGNSHRHRQRLHAVKRIDELREIQSRQLEVNRVFLVATGHGTVGRCNRTDLFVADAFRQRLLDYGEQ